MNADVFPPPTMFGRSLPLLMAMWQLTGTGALGGAVVLTVAHPHVVLWPLPDTTEPQEIACLSLT